MGRAHNLRIPCSEERSLASTQRKWGPVPPAGGHMSSLADILGLQTVGPVPPGPPLGAVKARLTQGHKGTVRHSGDSPTVPEVRGPSRRRVDSWETHHFPSPQLPGGACVQYHRTHHETHSIRRGWTLRRRKRKQGKGEHSPFSRQIPTALQDKDAGRGQGKAAGLAVWSQGG